VSLAASDGTTAAMAAARIAGSARDPGAWANGAERTRGSITRGQDADLVVLSRDIFTLTRAPRQILSVRADLTMVAGQVIQRVEGQDAMAAGGPRQPLTGLTVGAIRQEAAP
jgi:imidazolonepropionase-like amidohydrolase